MREPKREGGRRPTKMGWNRVWGAGGGVSVWVKVCRRVEGKHSKG